MAEVEDIGIITLNFSSSSFQGTKSIKKRAKTMYIKNKHEGGT